MLLFMLRYLMISWNLNIWKVKIWLTEELKELLKRSKIHFSFLYKCSLLDLKKTNKNVADTKATMYIPVYIDIHFL